MGHNPAVTVEQVTDLDAFLTGVLPDAHTAATLLWRADNLTAPVTMATPPDPERCLALEELCDMRTVTLARSSRDRDQLGRLCRSTHPAVRRAAAANPHCASDVAAATFAAERDAEGFTDVGQLVEALARGGCTPAAILERWCGARTAQNEPVADLILCADPAHRHEAFEAAASLGHGDVVAVALAGMFCSWFGGARHVDVDDLVTIGRCFDADSNDAHTWLEHIEAKEHAASLVVGTAAHTLGLVDHPLDWVFRRVVEPYPPDGDAIAAVATTDTCVVDRILHRIVDNPVCVRVDDTFAPLLEHCSSHTLVDVCSNPKVTSIGKQAAVIIADRFDAGDLDADDLSVCWRTLHEHVVGDQTRWRERIAAIDYDAAVAFGVELTANCRWTWLDWWIRERPDDAIRLAHDIADRAPDTLVIRIFEQAVLCGADPRRAAPHIVECQHRALTVMLSDRNVRRWASELCDELDTFNTTLANAICSSGPPEPDLQHLYERALLHVDRKGFATWLSYGGLHRTDVTLLRRIAAKNPNFRKRPATGDPVIDHFCGDTDRREWAMLDDEHLEMFATMIGVSVADLVANGHARIVNRILADTIGDDPTHWVAAATMAVTCSEPVDVFRSAIKRLAATWPTSTAPTRPDTGAPDSRGNVTTTTSDRRTTTMPA